MDLLGARDIVWVSAKILNAAGALEGELPLYRPEHGTYSGLMDVGNDRARAAGLVLTRPEDTLREVRAHLAGRSLTPLFSREREEELIGMVLRDGGGLD